MIGLILQDIILTVALLFNHLLNHGWLKMAEEKNEQFSAPKTPEGNKNPLGMLLGIINIFFLIGIGYFQYLNHQKIANQPSVQDLVKEEMKKMEDSQDKIGQAKEQDGILFPLEGFTANLAQDDGPRRFLRLNAVLKFSVNSSEEEFKARKPQIRDAIISLINAKRPDDLLKLEGKNFLKEEIKSSINSFIIDGSVIDVYYVGFQIN